MDRMGKSAVPHVHVKDHYQGILDDGTMISWEGQEEDVLKKDVRTESETKKRRGWITPGSSWGYYCSQPCPWRRRRGMAEAREACRRWGLSGSFLSFGLRLSLRGRYPATLRRREAWRGLRFWLRRRPLFGCGCGFGFLGGVDVERINRLPLKCLYSWRMKLLVCWGFILGESMQLIGNLGWEECIRLDCWAGFTRLNVSFLFVRMLVLCTWVWHMLRIDGACGLRSCPRPGFGGSDRRWCGK